MAASCDPVKKTNREKVDNRCGFIFMTGGNESLFIVYLLLCISLCLRSMISKRLFSIYEHLLLSICIRLSLSPLRVSFAF